MTHTDIIKDADAFFEIDPITRVITNKTPDKTKVMQYDHNSERFTFSMPQFVEGHDMANCSNVEVHYININTNTKEETRGLYEVKDVQMHPEESERIIFSWLLSQNVTRDAGVVHFIIRFSCVDAEGVIDYAWSSEIFKAISVSQGIYNADVIVELYADVLEQWKQELFDASAEGVENINTAKEQALSEIKATAENLTNPSNALKGTASGEAIGLHDVSPIEHNMAVKIRTKNIAFNDVCRDVQKGDTNAGVVGFYSLTLEKGKTYTMSFDTENTGGRVQLVNHNRPLTMVSSQNATCDGTRKSFTFTMTDDFYRNYIVTWIQLRSDSTANSGLCSNVMLEEGSIATACTPYVEDVSGISVRKYGENLNTVIATYTSNADGTVDGVTSLYPSTTLLTDTEGVVIDCEYNRDINKAFEELTQAIVSLGGNV